MQKHVRASAAFCIKLSCVEHQASTYSTSPHGAGLDTGGGDNDLKQLYFQSGIWTAATLVAIFAQIRLWLCSEGGHRSKGKTMEVESSGSLIPPDRSSVILITQINLISLNFTVI